MANQILAGAVFQAGQVIAGIDADNILDTFIAPSTGGPDEKYYLITSFLPSDHAVYLYDGSGNELVRIPKPNDTGDYWGRRVVTNGTKIAITDTYYYVSSNVNLGSLYIYDMDGSNMVKVTHSDASTGDYFGNSLKMNSTKIIVGAPYAGPIYRQGAIYVYDLDGTNEVKITTSDAGAYDELTGWNGLDVTESKILAGAAKHGGSASGAMYTFDLDGSNEFKFQPSDIDSSDVTQFGSYVAASETKVAVAIIGGVYIFDHDGTNEVKVTGEGSGIGAYGNTGVAINDTHIGVTDRNYSSSRGAFYIYDIDGTNEVRVDAPSSVPTSSGYFGTNLTMTSDKIYTSPLDDNSAGTNSGNVYEYNLDGTGERTLPTPSTFGPNSDFGDGLYVYDSSLIPSPPLPAFIAPSTTSSTVANKIFMWSSDAAAYQNGVGRSDVGGVVMTDGDFSNPTTIQLDSPQMVVGGEGKVVTIAQLGEIKVYDESTGQLEQTFNDSYLDSAKANSPWSSSNDAVIGAGKIFISSPEQNPNGVGSIIVVDLLDRNVATYLITPTLGNYSRLSATNWGGIKFIDGRIYGHTSMWSSADRGIWHFAPDGSDEQFIPVPGMGQGAGVTKWGDNFVVGMGDAIQVIDSSGAVLHSKSDPAGETFGFSQDFDVTSTGKLVALRRVDTYNNNFSIYLYDEGFTNEIVINGADQPNGIASSWGYGTTENSGGFEVFGEYILVSAKEADNNGIANCGAVYRYNDSGVLQDIFYGTVADQKIGTNISVGTATTTTALPTFIAPPAPSYTPFSGNILYLDAADSNSYSGSGNTWTDLSSEGNDATFTSSVVYDSNDGGGSFVFDGTKAVVNSSQLGGISATDHTIICWVNPNHIGEGDVIGTDGTSFGDVLLMVYVHARGFAMPGIRGHVWSSSRNANTTNSTALIENGNWYMITQRVTWGGNIDLFQNETITASQSLLGDAPTTYATSNKLVIGGRVESGGPSFDGNIGIVSIYNRALTDSEISEEYNANVSRFS